MAAEEGQASNTPANSGNVEETVHSSGRRMSHFKDYKFFRSFSAKVGKWQMKKAEALWRRMRERKIAGTNFFLRNNFFKFFEFVGFENIIDIIEYLLIIKILVGVKSYC